MINGMYLSTMGGMVQSARHEAIANNLANANSTGFKPDWSLFRAVDAESVLQGKLRREVDPILEKTGGGVWLERTYSNFRAGPIRETGSPLNVALRDNEPYRSFFKVGAGDQVRYTRDGNFHINSNGQLVMTNGTAVLGPDNQPITIPPGAQVHIDETGAITDAANANADIGQLGVVQTTDLDGMTKIGNSLFKAKDDSAFEEIQYGVLSGKLESSATNPIQEMTNMIEASRMYQANMRFLTIQDGTLGDTVRRIASVA